MTLLVIALLMAATFVLGRRYERERLAGRQAALLQEIGWLRARYETLGAGFDEMWRQHYARHRCDWIEIKE